MPSSIAAIQNQTLTEGNRLSLTCQASGIPPPSVSWVRVSDGQLTNLNQLVITNINRSEAGEYRCEASNECGNASESAVIVVQCKLIVHNNIDLLLVDFLIIYCSKVHSYEMFLDVQSVFI